MKWTKKELEEFDTLIDMVGSLNQLERIFGRLSMTVFVKKHGKEKCDAMFKHLEGKKK